METRPMRRNKYTMEQIDRLEQSNQELLEKNQTLQETNSVLSHALSVVSKSTHIPTQIYTLTNTPSLKEKMQLRRSVRVANFRRQRTTSMG